MLRIDEILELFYPLLIPLVLNEVLRSVFSVLLVLLEGHVGCDVDEILLFFV